MDGNEIRQCEACGVRNEAITRRICSDERGLTAVVEFLSAFVLFLVIVSAFLALSQLKLGSNVNDLDRLDRMAVQGLERLTDSKGFVTPVDEFGQRDIANGTVDWHHFNATVLLRADLLPGLGDGNGRVDPARLAGLANVTEDKALHGLGLPEWASLNLTVIVSDSTDENRVGTVLFQDGSSRSQATQGSTATRTLHMGDETLTITLEVHDAGRVPSAMHITEFMAEPTNGAPEWVELYNPDGFALNLTGWGLSRPGASSLVGDGALAGGDLMLCSGNPSMQWNPQSALIRDLGAGGVLGRGAIDGLSQPGDILRLTWTMPGTADTENVEVISWDFTWSIGDNSSLEYTYGGNPGSVTNWTQQPSGTPGW